MKLLRPGTSVADAFDLSLILPDGTEFAYGPVHPATVPNVGEVIWFQRTDPEGKLIPDEGLEGPRWVVLGREWSVRLTPHYRVTFLTLRLGSPDTPKATP